ncbi:MAG: hypothetical protein WC516_09115 [Patescibacteria group bacterium]|jgi:hypothetical protein
MEDNITTYEEWFSKLSELISLYKINDKIEDYEHIKQYWTIGYSPAVALKFMFPDYWRF